MKALTWHGKRDSAIDALGMEAHGSPGAKIARQVTGMLPDAVAEKLMEKAARGLRA
jgi:hypothetical protein